MRKNAGRCGEIWGDVGRCGEIERLEREEGGGRGGGECAGDGGAPQVELAQPRQLEVVGERARDARFFELDLLEQRERRGEQRRKRACDVDGWMVNSQWSSERRGARSSGRVCVPETAVSSSEREAKLACPARAVST